MDNDASLYFRAYTKSFRGKSYMKAAYQKTAWHSLLTNGDEKMYRTVISHVNEVGNTMLDEDKSAQKEFESGKIPNRVLLKARLQFDGSYYSEALKTLISSKTSDLSNEEEKLEFTYRLARIHDELGNRKEAIAYYEMTIQNGSDSKRYFAANSSLMLGLMYEKSGQKALALKAFEACSEFNNSEYENSINQKAKAGILRLKD
jgi:tetratricopeptide (TPR) repeat protein